MAELTARYAERGHVTVPGVFSAAEMDEAIADIHAWGEEFLAELSPAERRWYVDSGVKHATVLRKLDNPVFHRPAIRRLAAKPTLVELVETLIGKGVSVVFSQVFFKPPRGGGPKPVHQDNWYFGPEDPEGLVTAWVALDDADLENGCMHFGEGTHKEPLVSHVAPEGQPFNLLIPEEVARKVPMTPAPVPKGGVSFHHGNVFHQSADNNSDRWRRAVAMHYVRNGNRFVNAALTYDSSVVVRIS
ncbi:MAG: phytanoyl-CoA dioxygenase family protein [Rhodospirillales bacterium]|nr:phytanoyl-CoA dioxygenase family protein [Rhodospirillales bacterium]